jgi:hypothetical protein
MLPKGTSTQEFAQHSLSAAMYEHLSQSVASNRWLSWEDLDQVRLLWLNRSAVVDTVAECCSHWLSWEDLDQVRLLWLYRPAIVDNVAECYGFRTPDMPLRTRKDRNLTFHYQT